MLHKICSIYYILEEHRRFIEALPAFVRKQPEIPEGVKFDIFDQHDWSWSWGKADVIGHFENVLNFEIEKTTETKAIAALANSRTYL